MGLSYHEKLCKENEIDSTNKDAFKLEEIIKGSS